MKISACVNCGTVHFGTCPTTPPLAASTRVDASVAAPPPEAEVSVSAPPNVRLVVLPFSAEQSALLHEILGELRRETSEEDDRAIALRALAIFRAVVRNERAGGKTKLVREGEADRTLKVRLR